MRMRPTEFAPGARREGWLGKPHARAQRFVYESELEQIWNNDEAWEAMRAGLSETALARIAAGVEAGKGPPSPGEEFDGDAPLATRSSLLAR